MDFSIHGNLNSLAFELFALQQRGYTKQELLAISFLCSFFIDGRVISLKIVFGET